MPRLVGRESKAAVVSDEKHDCHCAHVIVIQTKITIAQWLLGVLGVAIIGLIIGQVGQLVSLRVRGESVQPSSSERMFLDRVSH